MDTKIVKTRRERLRLWVRDNGTPPKEKSLFSQLKVDEFGSFGEKVARRLEEKYGMGEFYLDTPIEEESVPTIATSAEASNDNQMVLAYLTHAEYKIVESYRLTDALGKRSITALADSTRKRDIEDVLRNQG